MWEKRAEAFTKRSAKGNESSQPLVLNNFLLMCNSCIIFSVQHLLSCWAPFPPLSLLPSNHAAQQNSAIVAAILRANSARPPSIWAAAGQAAPWRPWGFCRHACWRAAQCRQRAEPQAWHMPRPPGRPRPPESFHWGGKSNMQAFLEQTISDEAISHLFLAFCKCSHWIGIVIKSGICASLAVWPLNLFLGAASSTENYIGTPPPLPVACSWNVTLST